MIPNAKKYSTLDVMIRMLMLFLQLDFVDMLYRRVICDGNKVMISANIDITKFFDLFSLTGIRIFCSEYAGT